jgi:transposase
VKLIFNVPYSPRYNAIEFYWKLVKDNYKRLRLGKLILNQPSDSLDMIKSSIECIEKKTIQSICYKTTLRIKLGLK